MDDRVRARIDALPDFWSRQFAFYLHEHQDRRNRATHMVGIPLLIVTAVTGLVMLDWRMFVGGQLLGWAIQLAGHRFEGNRPALLKNPVAFLMGPLMVLVEMGELLGLHPSFATRARHALARDRGADRAESLAAGA